jgi:hypothetical protein
MAMTVDQGTNHFWGWGYNYSGQVGNGTNHAISAGADDAHATPAQVQFCTRCQRCVQLGTGGVFTAQCNGTLYLYLNTDNFDAGTGQYNVTFGSLVTNVPAGAYAGIAVGTVTNGGTYSYHSSGICTYNRDLGKQADPDGTDPTTGNLADCSFAYLNKRNAVCPADQCFSLVGRIQ